jgi:hypothetical protein
MMVHHARCAESRRGGGRGGCWAEDDDVVRRALLPAGAAAPSSLSSRKKNSSCCSSSQRTFFLQVTSSYLHIMGGSASRNSSANRLAVSAMANVVHFTKKELMELQAHFFKLAGNSEKDNMINRAQMEEALKIVNIVESGEISQRCHCRDHTLF